MKISLLANIFFKTPCWKIRKEYFQNQRRSLGTYDKAHLAHVIFGTPNWVRASNYFFQETPMFFNLKILIATPMQSGKRE